VASARDKLVQETRRELVVRLGVSEVEAASIVRAALSGVGTTLIRRFGSPR
jgi:hypothetical protein